jgi:hypothetical protein
MRRAVEVALVVMVLVAVPVGVGIVARSEPSPGPPQGSALAVVQSLLEDAHIAPAHCNWTNNHADVACVLKNGGTCAFRLRAHSGTCSEEKRNSSNFELFNWASVHS